MVGKLEDMVTGDQLVGVLIVLFLIVYFVYKEWPDFKKRVSHGAVNEAQEAQSERTTGERLDAIEGRLTKIEERLSRDYSRLNGIEAETEKSRRLEAESLEEREIIMRALLGALGGLQELGANGPTKAAEQEINNYLNRQTHRAD